MDPSKEILIWSYPSWNSTNMGYEILTYRTEEGDEDEDNEYYDEWGDFEDDLDDRRRLDWWKDFSVLFDEKKIERRERIWNFLVKCWGDKDGSDVLSVLIEYLVECSEQ